MVEFFERKSTHQALGLSIERGRLRFDVSESRPTSPGKYEWHHAIVRLSIRDAQALAQSLFDALADQVGEPGL